MEKFYIRAASTMNYLFLRNVIGIRELDVLMKGEMDLFFREMLESNKVDKTFYDIAKNEMDEGGYLEYYPFDEFCEHIADSIENIMGEINENIYTLYTSIAREIEE